MSCHVPEVGTLPKPNIILGEKAMTNSHVVLKIKQKKKKEKTHKNLYYTGQKWFHNLVLLHSPPHTLS